MARKLRTKIIARKMRAYKVVVRRQGRLRSMIATPYAVTYEIGKWTKPKLKDSLLFAVKTLAQAKALSFREEVYLCEIKNPRRATVIAHANKWDIKSFWRDDSATLITRSVALGTLFATEVKLLKKVQ